MEKNLLKNYVNMHIAVKEECYENAVAFLQFFEFTGIEERFDELIITMKSDYFNDDIKNQIIEMIKNADPDAKLIRTETIEEINWNEEWEKNVQPIRINDEIVITPEWKKDDLDAKYKIVINPKMSFGTGEHQTTRLISRLMQKNIKSGQFWIDAGTGTGVLAIFAVMLGAESVYAFDNNIWSIENAKENFELNAVSDQITLEELDIENCTLPEADGIAANLFLNLVVPSLPVFYKSLKNKKGDLLISGILKYHLEDILEAAKEIGFSHVETIFEDDWIAIHFKIEG